MKRTLFAVASMFGSYFALLFFYDAPQWGAVIGSWVFWVTVRPKEWT